MTWIELDHSLYFLVNHTLANPVLDWLAPLIRNKNTWIPFYVVACIFLYKRNKEGKIGQFIKGMGQGLGSILNLEKKALFFFYTFCIWASYLSLIYIGFFALAATEHLGLEAALSVLVLGSVGMILTPGGLGAYPQILQYVLHSFYGVGLAFGLAFGWISWLAQTLIMIIFGILSFIVLPIYNKAKNG